MNTKLVKQTAIIFALMVGAISLMSFLPVAGAALIDNSANIPAVSEATGGSDSLRDLIITMVDYFLGFLGLVAVLMVIYGGVTYVTAAGKDDAVEKGKKIIMYALIGLVIVLLSFVVVNFIIGSGTGTEVA